MAGVFFFSSLISLLFSVEDSIRLAIVLDRSIRSFDPTCIDGYTSHTHHTLIGILFSLLSSFMSRIEPPRPFSLPLSFSLPLVLSSSSSTRINKHEKKETSMCNGSAIACTLTWAPQASSSRYIHTPSPLPPCLSLSFFFFFSLVPNHPLLFLVAALLPSHHHHHPLEHI